LYAYNVETNPSLPPSVEFHKLPSICIIPARKKEPPFTYFSGKGKGNVIQLHNRHLFVTLESSSPVAAVASATRFKGTAFHQRHA
jgi:hypothetical protein